MGTKIPKQLSIPPMPQIKYKEDVTIDNLIRILEICKQEVGGNELIIFRDRDGHEFVPIYPIITMENNYNPANGEWLCHRILIEVDK